MAAERQLELFLAAVADALEIGAATGLKLLAEGEAHRDEGRSKLCTAWRLLQKQQLFVVELNLIDTSMGNVGALMLAEAMTTDVGLENLHIAANNIGLVGMQALSKSVALHKRLTLLDLSKNPLGPEGCAQLAQALQVPSPTTIRP
jgi:Ran GTPase-activating protein (RanGAP) involved in mRNA processing and transport